MQITMATGLLVAEFLINRRLQQGGWALRWRWALLARLYREPVGPPGPGLICGCQKVVHDARLQAPISQRCS